MTSIWVCTMELLDYSIYMSFTELPTVVSGLTREGGLVPRLLLSS